MEDLSNAPPRILSLDMPNASRQTIETWTWFEARKNNAGTREPDGDVSHSAENDARDVKSAKQ